MSLDSTRQDAARVAAHVDLADVRMWGLAADLHSVPNDEEDKLAYSFNSDLSVQHGEGTPLLLVLGRYTLDLTSTTTNADGEDEEREVASIRFNLNALFRQQYEPDEQFEQFELTAFGETTGAFALYPYARELISDMTARMGLPSLHIGVMRLNLDNREGD